MIPEASETMEFGIYYSQKLLADSKGSIITLADAIFSFKGINACEKFSNVDSRYIEKQIK